jgi:hypothetical protein
MKILINCLIFIAIVITGCAQNITWDKPGASQQEFNQDNYACTQAAQQYQAPVSTPQPQGQMVSGYYVAPSWSQQLGAALANSSGGYSINRNLFNSCMQSKGYIPRTGSAQYSWGQSTSSPTSVMNRSERAEMCDGVAGNKSMPTYRQRYDECMARGGR